MRAPKAAIVMLSVGSLAVMRAAPTAPSPPGMRAIPAGEFDMGTDDGNSVPNERPAHRVKVSAFWLDEHDVTNAEFREFVAATGYVTTAERPVNWEELRKQLPPGTPKPQEEQLRPGSLVFTPPNHAVDLRDMSGWWTWTAGANWRRPQGPGSSIDGKDNYPVVQVSWDDAAAYAKWAGKRLPTEAEWEYAARGGHYGTRYYWGDELTVKGKPMANTFTGKFPYRNTAEDGYAGLSPAGAFPANGYGLFDMAGNAWNWCSDFYADDAFARSLATTRVCCDPAGPERTFSARDPNAVEHVVKGGSFLCNPDYCESYRPTARRGTPYDTGSEHVSFRCAKSTEPEHPQRTSSLLGGPR